MHLLVCSITEDISRRLIEEILEESNVEHVSWLKSNNGKRIKTDNNPKVGGNIRYLLKYESEDLLLVTVRGVDEAKKISEKIKMISGNENVINQFILPVIR